MSDCNKCIWSRRDGGCNSWDCSFIDQTEAANAMSSAQPTQNNTSNALKSLDCIDRQAAIDALENEKAMISQIIRGMSINDVQYYVAQHNQVVYDIDTIEQLPSAQPETEKYEYHYDHTDCIWYRPEARNRCPTTCAQYRDGWNDAMNYIFRDGKGYRPYRRDKQYGE